MTCRGSFSILKCLFYGKSDAIKIELNKKGYCSLMTLFISFVKKEKQCKMFGFDICKVSVSVKGVSSRSIIFVWIFFQNGKRFKKSSVLSSVIVYRASKIEWTSIAALWIFKSYFFCTGCCIFWLRLDYF